MNNYVINIVQSHYMLFNLSLAMQPRMLVTFDEKLQPLPVTVRVGQVTNLSWRLLMKFFCFILTKPLK